MLAAKLFAGLTMAFAVLAAFSRFVLFPGLDVSLHATFFAVGPELILLFSLVTCANFAVLYYAGERIFRAHWNRSLTLVHFCLVLCFAIALSIAFAISALAASGRMSPDSARWALVPLLVGILSLLASLLVFGINLTLSIAQVVRARFARH